MQVIVCFTVGGWTFGPTAASGRWGGEIGTRLGSEAFEITLEGERALELLGEITDI